MSFVPNSSYSSSNSSAQPYNAASSFSSAPLHSSSLVHHDDYDHLYKIILVGDATVGKTHLLSRYIRGTLPKSPKATIGVEFATRTVPLAVGGTVKAQIWDTAGQERYRSITSAHYRRAVGALLVYDVTRKNTFLNASKWLEELRQNAEPDIVVMLVGNKVDLVEKEPGERAVAYETAATYAQNNGLFFSEASAVSSFNVKHIFEHLLQEIYNQKTKGRNLGYMDGFGGEGPDGYTGGGGVAGGVQLSAGSTSGYGGPADGGGDDRRLANSQLQQPFGACCQV
eukprot:GHVQ01004961.1.p1 GENE.GHVQ01004961.1~~GHVQ01004961.1.p1  ORF type:complete len:283 (+),score=37.54 GHVQ01004961.1:543-1391(+)